MIQAERSPQIWQVLIGAARNRQTLTYEMVGEMVGIPAVAVGNCLDPIQSFCHEKGLPPLTVLVVGKNTGHVSGGYVPASEEGADRESVYAYNWYSLEGRKVADF